MTPNPTVTRALTRAAATLAPLVDRAAPHAPNAPPPRRPLRPSSRRNNASRQSVPAPDFCPQATAVRDPVPTTAVAAADRRQRFQCCRPRESAARVRRVSPPPRREHNQPESAASRAPAPPGNARDLQNAARLLRKLSGTPRLPAPSVAAYDRAAGRAGSFPRSGALPDKPAASAPPEPLHLLLASY